MEHEKCHILQRERFQTISFRACHLLKSKKDELLVLALYVNDLIFMENSQKLIDEFKMAMKNEFEMIKLRIIRYFLNLEIRQKKIRTFISQGHVP
jgi:Reverse transcriptase (RNA-dependent DNA polymerase)